MKSYVFKVAIEPDKFEDGRDAWHASCPALKGCHTATVTRKRSQISARRLTFTFKTFSKPGRQFPWIKAPSSWQSLPFLSMYDACPARPVGSPIYPRFGRRRIRTSTSRVVIAFTDTRTGAALWWLTTL